MVPWGRGSKPSHRARASPVTRVAAGSTPSPTESHTKGPLFLLCAFVPASGPHRPLPTLLAAQPGRSLHKGQCVLAGPGWPQKTPSRESRELRSPRAQVGKVGKTAGCRPRCGLPPASPAGCVTAAWFGPRSPHLYNGDHDSNMANLRDRQRVQRGGEGLGVRSGKGWWAGSPED